MFKLNRSDIVGIELELTGRCNLSCPLCLSRLNDTKDKIIKKNADLNKIIETIESFPNLQNVSIAGIASEPTLYPDLIKLLDYLKTKPHIFVELFSNGTLYNEEWWTELNTHFHSNSMVYFTICGTTQELHSKYRVGSNLDTIIKHALAFKKNNPHTNDCMQYIVFNYNKKEYRKENKKIVDILNMFSHKDFISTYPYPFFNLFKAQPELLSEGFCSSNLFQFLYKNLLDRTSKKIRKNITCFSYEHKRVYIDVECNIYPCVCYYLFNKFFTDNNILDYSEIFSGKLPCCSSCDKDVIKLFYDREIYPFYFI